MSKVNLKEFRTNPIAFIDALVIPSASGPQRFGDCMADFQAERFEGIAPSLVAIANGDKPDLGRHWWEASKGASKDSDLACCLLWLLAFAGRPLTCQVGAADRDQAGEMLKACKDLLRLNAWLAKRVESQAWKLICKATGSECEIIPADVSGSHGARPDVVILNELSHVAKQEFAENLLDNAAKVPNGLAVIATNAGFKNTWQAKWRALAETSDRWQMHVFSQPSPWLDDQEIEESERRNSRSRFMRLFWGEWVSQSGDALDAADIDACIDDTLAPMGKRKDWFFVGGLDLSVTQDHSALVIVGGNRSTQQIQLAYAESWQPDRKTGKVDLMRIEETCFAMHQKLKLEILGCDPYQAALMMQRLTLRKMRIREVPFVGKNLDHMASTMLDVFRSRRIALYPNPQLIADIRRLSIVERSYGYRLEAIRTTKTDGTPHADLATALAIALPIVVEYIAKPRRIAGPINANHGKSAYELKLEEFQRRHEQHREIQEEEQYWAYEGHAAEAKMRALADATPGIRRRW